MAIKSNVVFKGLNLSNIYIKLEKVRNKGDKIGFELGLYTYINNEKGELIDVIYKEIDDSTSILNSLYSRIKATVFNSATDV